MIKGGIEVTGRPGRRRRKLLDDLKDRRGYRHLKEKALDRTIWWPRFGRGFVPVVRQTAEWMNELTVTKTTRTACRHSYVFVSGWSFIFSSSVLCSCLSLLAACSVNRLINLLVTCFVSAVWLNCLFHNYLLCLTRFMHKKANRPSLWQPAAVPSRYVCLTCRNLRFSASRK